MKPTKHNHMLDLLALQKQFILAHLREGDTAVDFTMGNGHDTAFLSHTVGASGRVFAFDVQEAALASTAQTLRDEGCPDNVTLIHASHHRVLEFVPGPIRAGMFNLGYLPGGDKRLTTLRATTMPAVEGAISLLGEDAVLLIAVYPGHAEGAAEGEMLGEYFASLDRRKICATRIQIVNSPTSPFFFVLETK